MLASFRFDAAFFRSWRNLFSCFLLVVGGRLRRFALSNTRSCLSSIEIDVSETVRFPQRSEVESGRQ